MTDQSDELTAARACQATFEGAERDAKLADKIEREQPHLRCEAYSVSPTSPGPIDDNEMIYRVMISPRDLDETGFVHEAPFRKVASTGLSVIRSIASRDDLFALASDGMFSREGDSQNKVLGVFQARVGAPEGIRAMRDGDGERLFGVYDQTVSRVDKAAQHVPTHGGVFLRVPPPGTPGRKETQKDHAGELRNLFLDGPVELNSLYGGVLTELNEAAADGRFVVHREP